MKVPSLIRFGRRYPALLALQGIVLFVAATLLVFNLDRVPLFAGTPYRVVFSDASGLQGGEEVRISGIKVGKVTGIELVRDTVVVDLELDDVEIGDRTSASIEIRTLLGQHYVALTPAGTEPLRAGATIPLERTTTPMNIVPTLQQATGTLAGIDTDRLAEAFDSLAEVVEAAAPEAQGALDGLSRLSTTLASRDAQVRRLFRDAEQVTEVLAARDSELAELLGDTSAVLEMLDRRKEVVSAIIKDTSAFATQLRSLVTDNKAALEPTLTRLDRVLDVLREHEEQLGESIEGTVRYGKTFTNVGGTGPWFDGTIKLPAGYAVCASDERTIVNQLLDPVLSQLNEALNGSTSPCLPLGPAATSAVEAKQ
ncbi:phospholipid/cholesterol/gamma-HCH transport system substrate-binding protein [Nocardioides sp. J9]|uniref:MCE family protein n=1 Tax=Nocardioides sp. J9 TaxID=935844 RepID=UPI0011ACC167|nr:MlaD family protein [Nocardioides sp. J9]TWH02703.1 phospholipid/cholesterol/gamma-HCH transport system substrate-binding protein [Nocardioides sp. J9]